MAIPFVADLAVRRELRDDFELPDRDEAARRQRGAQGEGTDMFGSRAPLRTTAASPTADEVGRVAAPPARKLARRDRGFGGIR